ncbi:hypothetical protein LX73_1391 [Fodinibius salinus]|uniref:Lipoprotein n=1 Tax=Fodinibius salinus TaxID=860790 RepID=A0A5D3YJE6_9BACT|nr:hypothetical protein [Fodinibius salinus]TYP93682.1 hypothetical protein LX73_1391 [Fodinibius salinus]
MKTSIVSFLLLLFAVVSCSSTKHTTQKPEMQIVTAKYAKWSDPPKQNSDVPEKGVDITLTVKNWPDSASPSSVIYNQRKSSKPKMTQKTDSTVVINARIVIASSLLVKTSDDVALSDRLVYNLKDGQTQFIEIENWTRMQE